MKILAIATLSLTLLPRAFAQTASDHGISVAFSASPLQANQDSEITVRLRDKTGAPITGAGINGWLSVHRSGAPALDRDECVARVATFTAGGIFRQPAVDLNSYNVVILNADATLSIVDPKIAFGGTSLLAMVTLASPGEDWTLDAARRHLFVAMPQAGKVAVVDTSTWKVVANVDSGPRTARIVMQPDGGYVWAAYDGGVVAIDPREARVVARIPTGSGRHDVAATDDSSTLFVTNSESGTTSVIDVSRLRVERQLRSGVEPVSVDWSPLAHRAYVASPRNDVVFAIAPQGDDAMRIPAAEGITRVRVAPGGRYCFVVNPQHDTVSILDTKSNRIVQTAKVDSRPFEVTFSDTIAYIRHLGTDTVLMITLANIGRAGEPITVADFTGGEHPFGANGIVPIAADGIVQAAGENAVLVTNPADGQIYYYREGLAAPSGGISAYSHTPRAALVIDRSLREVKPGLFTAIAKMPKAGEYDVALFVDSPRVVTCFGVTVR